MQCDYCGLRLPMSKMTVVGKDEDWICPRCVTEIDEKKQTKGVAPRL